MSQTDLCDYDIVIGRPLAQAREWQKLLQERGAKTQLLPVMEIVPVDEPAQQQAIKTKVLALADYNKVVFVSRNAVQHAMEWVDRYWPQLPAGLEYFAVGSATADAARDWGLNIAAAGEAMNSEAMLELPGLRDVQQQKILIFRGVGGRNFFSEQLRRRGARVDFCELYQRRIPAEAEHYLNQLMTAWELRRSKRTWVLALHSGESLQNLTRLLAEKANPQFSAQIKNEALCLVPGERVGDLAQQLGYRNVLVALNATDAEMAQTLARHSRIPPSLK